MPYKQPPVEHQIKKGQVLNPNGRPKDTLKVYLRKKLTGMSEEEKEKWVKDIPKLDQWKMGEGNPKTETDVTLNDVTPSDKQKELSDKAIGDYLNK